MDWINVITTSISMSIDCMTVGATDGIREPKMRKLKALFISFIFGLFQAVMPMIGYFVGFGFKQLAENSAGSNERIIQYVTCWIAFAALSFLSIKSIISFVKEYKESKSHKGEEDVEERTGKLNIKEILSQGVATSIDALCIGFVYLDYDIPTALFIFLIIGAVTFLLSFICIIFGKIVGGKLSKYGELIAGIAFLAIGLKILISGNIEFFTGSTETTALLLSYLSLF